MPITISLRLVFTIERLGWTNGTVGLPSFPAATHSWDFREEAFRRPRAFPIVGRYRSNWVLRNAGTDDPIIALLACAFPHSGSAAVRSTICCGLPRGIDVISGHSSFPTLGRSRGARRRGVFATTWRGNGPDSDARTDQTGDPDSSLKSPIRDTSGIKRLCVHETGFKRRESHEASPLRADLHRVGQRVGVQTLAGCDNSRLVGLSL